LETVARSVDLLGAQLAAMNDQLLELTQKASTTEELLQEGADGAAIKETVAEVASDNLSNWVLQPSIFNSLDLAVNWPKQFLQD
jgi:hypothetical protein